MKKLTPELFILPTLGIIVSGGFMSSKQMLILLLEFVDNLDLKTVFLDKINLTHQKLWELITTELCTFLTKEMTTSEL